MKKYTALVLENFGETFSSSYQEMEMKELSQGEVRIRIEYSSINYKDRLAMNPSSRVVRSYPMIPGIDFAGSIVQSESQEFMEGDVVFVTGFGFGTDMPGGFREYIEVHERYLSKVPSGMTTREAMVYGTAGFTAALSVDALQEGGVKPGDGSILVTGGSGGVASQGILILKKLGYDVTVATRSLNNSDYLLSLGADELILFESLLEPRKALSKEKWAGVIDATGGEALGNILKEVRYGGVVALSGNLSGIEFSSTVFPFILRGISLMGIDSVNVALLKKSEIFEKLASDWKSDRLERTITREVPFLNLNGVLENDSVGRGRDLVTYMP